MLLLLIRKKETRTTTLSIKGTVIKCFYLVLFYLLTASREANNTSPGNILRNAFPGWDLTKGPITVPLTMPTPLSKDLLSFSVIFDNFLTLHCKYKRQLSLTHNHYTIVHYIKYCVIYLCISVSFLYTV